MSEDTDEGDVEQAAKQIRASRLVYGAMLVGDQLNLVECVDQEAFEDKRTEQIVLSTAFNNIGAMLVPLVADRDSEWIEHLPVTITPHLDESFETPRLTEFETVADLASDARAYYFLTNTREGNWKRIQNTVAERFTDSDELSDPETGRYVVAAALVDEARDRFATLPEGISADEIELIDWAN